MTIKDMNLGNIPFKDPQNTVAIKKPQIDITLILNILLNLEKN